MTDRLFADCCYGSDQQHTPEQACPQTPFTPGPWSVGELDDWNSGSNLPPEIGLCVNGSSWGKVVESVTVSGANAHLIAAAPDLYAALEAMLSVCEKEPGMDGYVDNSIHADDVAKAHAALAKARGEAA